MKKFVFPFTVLLLVILSLPQNTAAQRKVDLGEAEFSYAGIYVRANVGLGAGMAEWIDEGQFKGGGVSITGRIGYRFSKGIGLHGVVSSGIYTNISSEDFDPLEKLDFLNFGGGPTFFFGKGYSYLIIEVVYTQIKADNGYEAWKTNGGVGGTLSTGYDFNLAKNVGIGLSVFVHAGSMQDSEDFWIEDPPRVINLFYGFEVSIRIGK